MNEPLYLIYIPGLGDEREPKGQLWAVARWSRYGVEAELFRMRWGDREPWQPKFERLLARLDELSAQGKAVGLIGASAGASAAINAFAARKDNLVGVVLIAGKVNRPEAIHAMHNTKNPAFVESVEQCAKSLEKLNLKDRQRILSLYGLYDGYVKKTDSYIPGAHNQRVFSFGHFWNIALQLTTNAEGVINFLKSLV